MIRTMESYNLLFGHLIGSSNLELLAPLCGLP